MFDDGVSVLMACLTAVALCVGSWVSAHSTIADECKKLGGFYVGNTVFKCEVVK